MDALLLEHIHGEVLGSVFHSQTTVGGGGELAGVTFQKRNGNVKAKTCQKLFYHNYILYILPSASSLLVLVMVAASCHLDGDRFFSKICCVCFRFSSQEKIKT